MKKAKRVTPIRLSNWSDIVKYEQHGWLYRGQKDESWDLVTSLERTCRRLGVSPDSQPEAEERLLRQFKRAYHQYAPHIPEKEAILEWFSIMQHHGAPTRLLDFTYSIYVAAYFAMETAETDCAVWALSAPWALQASMKCFRAAGRPKRLINQLDRPFMENNENVVRKLCYRNPYVLTALPTNPFRLNERLRIQQGAFVIPGDITNTFMSNLLALPDADDPKKMVKIIIPKSERREALTALWSMGISRAILFPGMDGYAQSLGVYHSLFKPTPYGKSSTSLIEP